MFNALIIAANHLRFGPLQYAAVQSQQLLVLRAFDRYPLLGELERILRAVPPDVIVLDLDDKEQALRLAETVHATCPDIAIIGMEGDEPHRVNIAANGILYVIPFPCGPEDVVTALDAAIHAVDSAPCERLFTFLPSKAGTGCTTIALHTALALAQRTNCRTLLLEADLRSGTIEFQLNCPQHGSIQNVLASGADLDHFIWDQNIITYRGLQMLLTNGTAPLQLPSWREYHGLLRLALKKYDAILVDMPELVNPGTAELVRRSQAVYVVAAPDPLSIKLASRRLHELTALGIRMEKVSLLLSRGRSGSMTDKEISQLLETRVAATFPEDNNHLPRAVRKSEPVALDSPLGSACSRFAAALVENPAARTPMRKVTTMLQSFVGW